MARKTARKRSYKRLRKRSTRKQSGGETSEQYYKRAAEEKKAIAEGQQAARNQYEKERPEREKRQAEQKRQIELENKVKMIKDLHQNADHKAFIEENRWSTFQKNEDIQQLKQKNEAWMKAINETVDPQIQPMVHKFKIDWLKERIKRIEDKIANLKKENSKRNIDKIHHLEWLLDHILEYIPTNDPSVKEAVDRNKQTLEVSKKEKKIIQREKEVIKPLIDKYMNIIQMRFQIAYMNADIRAAKNYPNKIEAERKLISELEPKIGNALRNIKAHPTAASMYSDKLKKDIERSQLSSHDIRWYQQTDPSKIDENNNKIKGYQNRIDFLASQSGGIWPFGPSNEEIAAKAAAEKAIKNAEEAAKAKKIANNAAAEKAKQNAEEAANAKKIANNAAAEKAIKNAEETAKAKKIANNTAAVQNKEAQEIIKTLTTIEGQIDKAKYNISKMEKDILEAGGLPLQIGTLEKQISDIKTELQTEGSNLQSSDPEGYAIYVNMVKELINNTSRDRTARKPHRNSEFANELDQYIKQESGELQALIANNKTV